MQNGNFGILLKVYIASSICAASLLASVGKITVVSGQVVIDRGGKSIEAKAGTELNQKDILKSKPSSNAQLVFADQTVITIGPNSTFSIEEYTSDDKSPSAKFKAGDGAFKAITGKIGKLAPDKFKVETKTATIGIRGTRLIIVSQGNQETYACTKGAITATPKVAPFTSPGAPGAQPAQQQPEQKTIVIQAGQMTTSTGGQIALPKSYTPTEIKQLEKSTESGVKTSSATQPSDVQMQTFARTQEGTETVATGTVGESFDKIISSANSVKNDAAAGTNQDKMDAIDERAMLVLQYAQLADYMEKDIGTKVSVNTATGTISMVMSEFVTPSYGTQKAWVSTDKKYVFINDASRLDYMIYPNLAFMSGNRFTVEPYASYYDGALISANPFEIIGVKSSYGTAINGGVVTIKNSSVDTALSSQGFTGFVALAGTFAEVATNIDSVLANGSAYGISVAKYEAAEGQYKKWTRLPNGVFEEYKYSSGWNPTNNYLANYNTISGANLTSTAYSNFYIYGVPTVSQNLPGYLGMTDGGKWYFRYDSANPAYAGTIQISASAPYTDAVKVSAYSDIPFMASKGAANAYPTFYKNDGGYNYIYTQRPTGDYYASISGANQYDAAVNVEYYNTDGSAAVLLLPSSQKAMYVFQKVDVSGNLVADSRNGTVVNPLTGNTVNIYANKMTFDGSTYNYLSGPINNPIYDQNVEAASGHYIDYTDALMGFGSLDLSTPPTVGTPFWKLAIEKASWSDKPINDGIFVYSDYDRIPNSMALASAGNASMYIKYFSGGDAVMLSGFIDAYFERSSPTAIVKTLFDGGVMTGRVVADGSLNKVSGRYFDLINGVITTDTYQNGYANRMYMFNEGGQYINSSIGGLDNVQSDTTTKYNWIAHELYNTSGVVQNISLMKQIADNTDTSLFGSIGGYSLPNATMKGFAVGGDTSDHLWMGNIDTLDTRTMSGILSMSNLPTGLGVAPDVNMAALSQVDTAVSLASASFLNEDIQGMIVQNKVLNGKTYDFAMASMPDSVTEASKYSYMDDYSTWGYWMARETDASSGCSLGSVGCTKNLAIGYWVAGYETPVAMLENLRNNSQVYSYYGNIVGTVNDGTALHPIKLDGYNSFAMGVSFGAANPIQIMEVKFNTANNIYSIASSGVSTQSAFSGQAVNAVPTTITSNGFNASADWGSGANFMNMVGKFYGPAAESVGGAWSGSFNSGALQGIGVFKARR